MSSKMSSKVPQNASDDEAEDAPVLVKQDAGRKTSAATMQRQQEEEDEGIELIQVVDAEDHEGEAGQAEAGHEGLAFDDDDERDDAEADENAGQLPTKRAGKEAAALGDAKPMAIESSAGTPKAGRKIPILAVIVIGFVVVLGGLLIWKLLSYYSAPPVATGDLNLPKASSSPAVLANALTFVAIGDWGREGLYGQRELAGIMGQWAEATQASFVVSVGDNFYTYGVDSGSDPQWESSWSSVYTHPAFKDLKWKVVNGNHDWRGASLQFNSAAAGNVGGSTKDPRWSFPFLYFAEEWPLPSSSSSSSGAGAGAGAGGACVQALFIDTVPLMSEYRQSPETAAMRQHLADPNLGDRQRQLAWIKDQLETKRNGCKASIVVGHHPVYSGGEHNSSPDLIRDLLPLLEANGVQLMLSGHDHNLQHLKKASSTSSSSSSSSPDFVVTGAGSKIRAGTRSIPELRWFADENGFTIHSINATAMLTSFIGNDGAIAYQFSRQL